MYIKIIGMINTQKQSYIHDDNYSTGLDSDP